MKETHMQDAPGGFLAVWSTVAPENETDYLHWLTREHVFERVGVEGFVSGRVFRHDAGGRAAYFILYALRGPEVVASPFYLARLNAPTPWSQRIMPILGDFRRGGGAVLAQSGSGGHGSTIGVFRFDRVLPDLAGSGAADTLDALSRRDMISTVTVLGVVDDATRIATREKSMRTSVEASLQGMLIVEGITASAVEGAMDAARQTLGREADAITLYREVFSFHR